MKTIKSCLLFGVAAFFTMTGFADDVQYGPLLNEGPGYDAEVLATFYGFATPTNGAYTAVLNGSTVAGGDVTIGSKGIRLESKETWSGNSGISVLVKYRGFIPSNGNSALVTFKNTSASALDSGLGVYATNVSGRVHGIWRGSAWSSTADGAIQVDNQILPASGYMVLSYDSDGTALYDGAGGKLYAASALKATRDNPVVGDVLTIGGTGTDSMIAAGLVVEGARIFKGALAQDEIAAAVAGYEGDRPLELSEMYLNRLSLGDEIVPAGTYGAIAVPGNGYKATAFSAATQLDNTPSGDEIAGTYTNIIKTVGKDTDIAAHTLAGWFKVDALPTAAGAANVKTLYAAKSRDGSNFGGYKVAVDSTGKIYVGQCDDENWRNDAGKSTVHTTAAHVVASNWFHLAVTMPGRTDGTRTTTATVFVNGAKVETAGGPFGTNLNGNRCEYVRIGGKDVTSDLGISAAGIYVDNAALDDARAVVKVALEAPKPYEPVPPTPTLPDADFAYEPKVNASPTGWMTDFEGERFLAGGQFRIGPDGECVSAVSSGQHPYSGLSSKSNYTMALYADISQMAYDKTGRYMLTIGSKNNGINQGLLMTQDGNVRLYQANGSTVQYTLNTTSAPAAGYHLFVWTQSTANGGTLYIDGEKIGTIPDMTSATSAGFQIGNMHGGVWNNNYSQGIGMAVAGAYGWDQVLDEVQVELLAEQCPPVLGGIEATSVSPSISGTLNLVEGDSISNGTYACSIAVAYGATVDLKYDGVVQEGAQILSAKSVSAEGATFTINGEPLPEGLEFDTSGGRIVIGKPKVTKLLNPYAVKNGDVLKVSCNADAAAGEAAKAYDGNASTYFAPGDAANAKGVSWTGIEFTNGVVVTEIAFVGNYARRMIGGVFQGANLADYSDATNICVVESYSGGTADIVLAEAKGPYRYLRFVGMYGGNVSEIRYYGLADSGALAPTNAPTVLASWSTNGVAGLTLKADATIPQVYVVQRAMRNFCEDESDYETCATLAPQPGVTTTWIDGEATGYALYRMQGFNANGTSAWTYFEIEPEKLIAGPVAPTFGGNGPGFYADEAVVTIDYPVANAKIYYTLDGSTPTTNSLLYVDGITLQDVCAQDNPLSQIMTNPKELTNNIAYGWRKPNGDQPNVNVIRARAFLPDGSASTNEIAGTWMIGPTVSEHLTNGLRVVSVITDRENYFGDPKGIMVPGDIYNERGWVSGQVGQPNANYFQRGADWERPAFIEMFDEKGVEMFSNKMGTRVHGNWSRASAKKTLVCYSRKELGSKNIKLDKKKFRMFNDEPDHNKYKRIMLRNGGNDWYKACLRDAVGQSMFRGYVNTDTQGYEPMAMYVNGEYWGIYNLRHAYSKQHFEDWNGAVEDDIDYVKLDPDSGDHFEVQEGDFTAMWNIMQYMITCTKDGKMDDAEYAVVSNQVDIADMIDFHIVNIFLCNADWIKNGNNMGYWRNRSGNDRKWHFTVYDCDSAMAFDSNSYADSDKLSDALNVNDTNDTAGKMAPGFLKRCFMNDGFKKRFANRFADLLNTALRVERTTNIVAQAAVRIEPEIARTAARWTNMESYSKWKERLANFNAFFVNRPGYQWDQIKSRCNGGALANITLTNSVGSGSVKLNTIESGKEFDLPFAGKYFTDIPISLTATPDKGYEFTGWKIGEEIVSTEPTMTLAPTNGVTIQAVFEEAGASEQEKYLRLWGFCGVPLTGGEDGPGEFIVLTNLNPAAALDLEGAFLNICKFVDDWSTSKCRITFPAGSQIEAGGYLRIEKKDGLEVWTAIQNGDLKIKFLAANGASIYTMEETLSQKNKGVKDQDKFLKAIAYNQTPDDWEAHDNSEAPVKPEPPTPPPGPGGDVISGDFPDGTNIVLTAAKTIKIGDATFGGPLTISGADATIELQTGTMATASALTASGVLTIDGDGTLSLSNDVALITATGLVVSNGVLKLDLRNGEAKTSAVYLKGDFKQFGGTVSLNLVSDNAVYGIQVDKKDKEVYLEGGTFSVVVNAGEKSSAIKTEKGSSHANLKGGTTSVTMSGPTNRFINTAGKIKIGDAFSARLASTGPGARVFKADKVIAISGGVITGEATGAGSEIFSAEDTIEVSGGVVSVEAADDCFSAATNVVISGGKVQALSSAGDAIDSNGSMTISGGYVLAYALSPGCEALDVDPKDGADDEREHKLILSGGSVVAVGYKDIIHVPDAGSVACYTNGSVKYDKDNKYVEVAGTNDAHKTILTVNLKDKCAKNFSLVATCPGFIGTVSYTGTKPDKDKSYIEKLDENIDGAFLTTLDIVVPGEDKEMEAKTEEEARDEIKKYEVQLTEEDKQAGVPKDALKMEAVAVTNGTGEVTGYKAVVAVNSEVVPEPEVGEDGEVAPIVVTPGEGGMEVSVGIVNATMGLWYGYEVCNALGDGFANDVPSFNRATGTSITITGSKRSGVSSFFRVKVLPAQPAK